MISAILVGVVVFLIANLFLAAGTAGLIGLGVGILTYLAGREDRL